MRFQDEHGAIQETGIFHKGTMIAPAPDDLDQANALRNNLQQEFPGCELLGRCNTHPHTAAVDCQICWPINNGDVTP